MAKRILCVVTLVSPNGEYGGPLRVAVNQSVALLERGHDVVIAGSFRGYETRPQSIEGVPARLFPAVKLLPGSGFAGLAAPRLWAWFARSAHKFDVVHVHAARDLVTMPVARIALVRSIPYVLQTHGMIDESKRALSKPLDKSMTIPVLRNARKVLYLTETERGALEALAGRGCLRLLEIPNGVPMAEKAAASEAELEVLYLGRLAYRKRPLAFIQAAAAIHGDFPGAKFTLVGPDDGEGNRVSALVREAQSLGVPVSWDGPIAPGDTTARMSRARVFVLPAVDEPYPMAVLEAMSVGLPVVVTESCGLASFVRETNAGLVADIDQESLERAIRLLLLEPQTAATMGNNGRDAVRASRSMQSIARLLEGAYRG